VCGEQLTRAQVADHATTCPGPPPPQEPPQEPQQVVQVPQPQQQQQEQLPQQQEQQRREWRIRKARSRAFSKTWYVDHLTAFLNQPDGDESLKAYLRQCRYRSNRNPWNVVHRAEFKRKYYDVKNLNGLTGRRLEDEVERYWRDTKEAK
jgi:hypothetical protein